MTDGREAGGNESISDLPTPINLAMDLGADFAAFGDNLNTVIEDVTGIARLHYDFCEREDIGAQREAWAGLRKWLAEARSQNEEMSARVSHCSHALADMDAGVHKMDELRVSRQPLELYTAHQNIPVRNILVTYSLKGPGEGPTKVKIVARDVTLFPYALIDDKRRGRGRYSIHLTHEQNKIDSSETDIPGLEKGYDRFIDEQRARLKSGEYPEGVSLTGYDNVTMLPHLDATNVAISKLKVYFFNSNHGVIESEASRCASKRELNGVLGRFRRRGGIYIAPLPSFVPGEEPYCAQERAPERYRNLNSMRLTGERLLLP